jgi:predicted DNA-binding ribbon-helix-helix protein
MAINPETHINASVVLERATYDKLKAVAKKNKRSVSAQIAFWVEQKIVEETLNG